MNVVIGAVHLTRAGQGVRLAGVVAAESSQVHLPEVELRLAIDDPVGHLPAHPTGAGNAMGTESSRDKEAAYPRLPQYELVVRGKCLRAVDQLDDLGAFHRGNPGDRVLGERLEAGPVLGQELVVEVARDAA